MPRLKAKTHTSEHLEAVATAPTSEHVEEAVADCPPSPLLKDDMDWFDFKFAPPPAMPATPRPGLAIPVRFSEGGSAGALPVGAESTMSEKKKGKKPSSTSAGVIKVKKSARKNVEEEEMSDDPYIQHWADRFDGPVTFPLTKNPSTTLESTPAFSPFPLPTRDQEQLSGYLGSWRTDDGDARGVLPDGSGKREGELRVLEGSVRHSEQTKAEMQLAVDEDGGWIERRPMGGMFWASPEGQEEGGELLEHAERRKADEGE